MDKLPLVLRLLMQSCTEEIHFQCAIYVCNGIIGKSEDSTLQSFIQRSLFYCAVTLVKWKVKNWDAIKVWGRANDFSCAMARTHVDHTPLNPSTLVWHSNTRTQSSLASCAEIQSPRSKKKKDISFIVSWQHSGQFLLWYGLNSRLLHNCPKLNSWQCVCVWVKMCAQQNN